MTNLVNRNKKSHTFSPIISRINFSLLNTITNYVNQQNMNCQVGFNLVNFADIYLRITSEYAKIANSADKK